MPVGERALSVGLEKKMQTQLLVTRYYAIYVRSVFDRFTLSTWVISIINSHSNNLNELTDSFRKKFGLEKNPSLSEKVYLARKKS